MFIIPSIDLSMKLSLSEVFVSNIIVTMVISNKSCCKHVLFTNLSDFISTTTRVTSLKSKKFLFCSFSVAKFGIAPSIWHFKTIHSGPLLIPPSVQWHYSSLQVTNIFREKIFDSHLQRVSSLLQPPSSVHELRNIESLSPHTTFQHSTVLLTHPLTTCSTHHLIYNSHKQFSRPWFISKSGIGIIFCVAGGFACQLGCRGGRVGYSCWWCCWLGGVVHIHGGVTLVQYRQSPSLTL